MLFLRRLVSCLGFLPFFAILTFLTMGNKPSKNYQSIPPCVLETLKHQCLVPYLQIPMFVRLCSKIWPNYPLDNNLKWSPSDTLNPDILRELSSYCQHTGRGMEFPYIQGFFYLSSKPSVLPRYSPAHMFLAMQSKSEEHPASVLYPANEPPPFQPQQTATSTSSVLSLPINYSVSPSGPLLLSGAMLWQPPNSRTHFFPSSHALTYC